MSKTSSELPSRVVFLPEQSQKGVPSRLAQVTSRPAPLDSMDSTYVGPQYSATPHPSDSGHYYQASLGEGFPISFSPFHAVSRPASLHSAGRTQRVFGTGTLEAHNEDSITSINFSLEQEQIEQLEQALKETREESVLLQQNLAAANKKLREANQVISQHKNEAKNLFQWQQNFSGRIAQATNKLDKDLKSKVEELKSANKKIDQLEQEINRLKTEQATSASGLKPEDFQKILSKHQKECWKILGNKLQVGLLGATIATLLLVVVSASGGVLFTGAQLALGASVGFVLCFSGTDWSKTKDGRRDTQNDEIPWYKNTPYCVYQGLEWVSEAGWRGGLVGACFSTPFLGMMGLIAKGTKGAKVAADVSWMVFIGCCVGGTLLGRGLGILKKS